MKKTISLILFLILVGCTGIIPGQSKETINLPDVHEGTTAIEMEYINGMPPSEVFENQLFEIGLELHNSGATDILNGIYNIALNEQYITMQDEKMNRFNIKGKSMYEPLGGKQIIQLKARTGQLGELIKKQSTTIIANACYEYATYATIITCMDTNQLKKETKVCTIQMQTPSGGQGGPVGVTSVETKILPHENENLVKPTYIIEIQNLGKGQIIDPGLVYDACTGRSIGKENYDIVQVNAMLSNDVLNCEPAKLKQKENKIVCELTQGLSKSAGNYQTPLILELNYGYIQTLPKTIQINKKAY
ncbi:hypothetical protein JW851_00515 [Candidatus Woesearchaeota archaeon]|nr:hypothetical protein [Candidatus Woesearchaeota archaeon]